MDTEIRVHLCPFVVRKFLGEIVRSSTSEFKGHSAAQPQPQMIKKKPRMNTNEHESDGSIRVNWCPFVVRKFFAKLRELQPQ